MSVVEKGGYYRRLVKRITIFVVILLILGGAYWWLSQNKGDWDFGTYNSVGDIAAVETKTNGAQAVIIKSNGKVLDSPDFKEGSTDRDPVWKPDGNRVFFVSDRNNEKSHIFRWNPDAEKVEQRSTDERTKGYLSFMVPGVEEGSKTALMTAGGVVLEFNPVDGSSHQLLPPRKSDVSSSVGQESSQGNFDATYQSLGNSFRIARWGKNKSTIIAVMRREDGEILVTKEMDKPKDPPRPIGAADHIDFDISKDGVVAYTLTNFQFPDPSQIPPELIQNGKVVLKVKHFLFLYDPSKPDQKPAVVASSNDDNLTFAWPTFSPDGQKIAVVAAKYDRAKGVQPFSLALMPATSGGMAKAGGLARGEITDISWNPQGTLVAYTKRINGKGQIFTVHSDGTGEAPLTPADRDFSQAVFSPQVASKG